MYDVLIIGLGCAGYTAAIYTARYKLKTFIVGAEDGGMGLTAAEVGNWPGIIDIKGPDLMENYKKHAVSFEEVTHRVARVEKLEKVGDHFVMTLQGGETVEGRTVILATGSKKRHLGVKGEEEFSGKGVTYCATCDAFFYRNKDVAVIGGGDSAVEGAAIAAQVAKTVYLIHRRKEFRAEPYWVDRVKARSNVVMVLENGLEEIYGDHGSTHSTGSGQAGLTTGKVRGVTLKAPFHGSNKLALDGVFIEIGSDPVVELSNQLGCVLDKKGFLVVQPTQESSVPGVFGAGDNTNESNYFAQFTTAAGEGAVAANGVFNYLSTVGAKGGYMSGGS